MLSDINQRKIPYDLTYIWSVKKQQKQKQKTQTHRCREQIGRLVVARGRGGGRGEMGEGGQRYELLVIK